MSAEVNQSQQYSNTLRLENERLTNQNRKQTEVIEHLNQEIAAKSSEYQAKISQLVSVHSQVEVLRSECESFKRANDSLITESNKFKQRNQRQNEELFKKL